MVKEWDEKIFQEWLDLRGEFRSNKKDKNWRNVITVCEKIILQDSQAKFIRIMTPIFYKEIANAYDKLHDIDNALKFYHIAKGSFIDYKNANELRNPSDWLAEIQKIDRKISKLSQSKT